MVGATGTSGIVDVVIVGAGLAGLSAAWELSRRGRSVVVLEQFALGHDRGSSHGGERIVRLAYTAREYVELCREAITGWRALEAEAGRVLLHATGTIDQGDAAELGALAATYEACGVAHEWLTPSQATLRWPGLAFAGPVLLQPDGGWIEAEAALASLAAGAVGRGAQVVAGAPVTAIEAGAAGVTVTAADGAAWAAGCAVVAAGAWAAPVLDGLVELPPITVTQEQVAYCRPLDPTAAWPAFILRGPSTIYGLPTPDGLLKVGGHGVGPVVDPDRDRVPVGDEVWARLQAEVATWVPGVDPTPVRTTSCLYATTPTDDLVLDRVGNVVVAAGLGGHGFKFGPAIGRVLADLVDGLASAPTFSVGRGAASPPGASGYR